MSNVQDWVTLHKCPRCDRRSFRRDRGRCEGCNLEFPVESIRAAISVLDVEGFDADAAEISQWMQAMGFL